jgi:hypothetical protein
MSKELTIVLSDLHVGKVTDDYNHDVALERLRSIPEQLSAKGMEADGVFVDRLRILLLGDLIEGEDIFPYQNATNQLSALEQSEFCIIGLTTLARKLLSQYPKARISVHSVRGNHGRLSKRAHPESNWDNIIARDLREKLSKDGIEVEYLAEKISMIVKIDGKKYACLHKAERHAATNALTARVLRRLRYYKADVLLGAHWHCGHRYRMDGEVIYIVNGSLCGPDEYSEQLGLFDPPRQLFFISQDGEVKHDWLKW